MGAIVDDLLERVQLEAAAGGWDDGEESECGGLLRWHYVNCPFKEVFKIVNWHPKFLKSKSNPNLSF